MKKFIKPGPAILVPARKPSWSFIFFIIVSAIFLGGIFCTDDITIAMFVEKSPCEAILGSSTSTTGNSEKGNSPFSNALFAASRIIFFIFFFIFL